MYKKLTAVILALTLLITGLAAASAIGEIADLTATAIDSTSVGVSWTAAGSDEPLYTVVCQTQGTDRSTQRRTYHPYCTINYLSPGTSYLITVSTKDGSVASTTITMPTPASYTDFNYQLLEVGVYESTQYEDDYYAITAINGATLADALDVDDFSFLFRFKLSATSQNKYLDFELTLTIPNGDVYTISDVLWYAMSRTTVTEYYAFDSALKRIYSDYGAFPAGEYTLTAYIDNGFAAETTFTME